MSATILAITQPNYFRAVKNDSGSDIPKCRIVKATSAVNGGALATAVTDAFVGVSSEIIYNGKSQSVQVDGLAIVETGGAFNIGDNLTTDAQGRAVVATQAAGASQNIIGRAATASGGAAEFAGVELKQLGNLFSAVLSLADRTAVKNLAANARFDGLLVLVRSDNSLWRFNSAAAQTEDTAQELVLTPAAGTGRWHRADKAFVMKIPVDFSMADGTTIETIPEGFAVRITGLPYWEVTASWTGGAGSSIGIASNKTGFTAAGAILGGATGDVAATLVAGIAAGTIGTGLDTPAEVQAALFEEGDTFTYEEITSAFTAGAGFVCVPIHLATAPATP
jgi:hypothetical protein